MTRGARRLLWLVGALLVLVTAAVWRAHAWADATIERHRRELEADVSKLRKVSRARPPLLEPVLPGNAYNAYGTVVASLSAPPVGPGAPPEFRFPKHGECLESGDFVFAVKPPR